MPTQPPADEPTIGRLVNDASRDISSLISKEIQLAKSELKLSVKFAGVGIALFAAAGVAWRRDRWVSVGVLWFAAAVFPISNLPFGAGALVTERSLYLPSAAVAFLAPPLVALVMGARPEMRRLAALEPRLVGAGHEPPLVGENLRETLERALLILRILR